MELQRIQAILNERTLTKAMLKKREEIAQAIDLEHPDMDMSKKMAIATAKAKSCCEDIDVVYENTRIYNYVRGYYRHLGLDPNTLRGERGATTRKMLMHSPAFHAWLRLMHYESALSDIDSDDILIEGKSCINIGKNQRTIHKALSHLGFQVQHGGNHDIYNHPDIKHVDNHLVVPRSAGKDIAPGTLSQLSRKLGNLEPFLNIHKPSKFAYTESKVDKILDAKRKSSVNNIEFYSDGRTNQKDKPAIADDSLDNQK